jgi:hypothetical protein
MAIAQSLIATLDVVTPCRGGTYRDSVLPPTVKARVSVEDASTWLAVAAGITAWF